VLYRLTFSSTVDGYLKVSAYAKNAKALTATHFNHEVFAKVLEHAAIKQPKLDELIVMSTEAMGMQGMDVCCEELDLSPEQLQILCLQPNSIIQAV
jgi:hypothetical protein